MNASPVAESGPWSLGVLVGGPVAAITIIVALVVAMWFALGAWRERRAHGDPVDCLVAAAIALGVAVIAGALAAAPGTGFYPYDSEYHQWREVAGVVEQVDSRQIADGKGMSERYVLVIDGQPFGVDDTRAATVRKGNEVKLSCKREWQYASESGWGCRWAGAEK